MGWDVRMQMRFCMVLVAVYCGGRRGRNEAETQDCFKVKSAGFVSK